MVVLRHTLLLFLIFHNAVSEEDPVCSDKEKCLGEECEMEPECKSWNCQNLISINTTERFDKFYEKCKDEELLRFRHGHELLIDSTYVTQAQVDKIFNLHLSICLRIKDDQCSLNLKITDSIEHSCTQDRFNLHYNRPTLLWIEKNTKCSLNIEVVAPAVAPAAPGSPPAPSPPPPILNKERKPPTHPLATPPETPDGIDMPLAILTEGNPPNITGPTANNPDYGIEPNLISKNNVKKRILYGDVIFTGQFPYDVEIEGLTIYGCFKVSNATNVRSMEYFQGIKLHDPSLCHGERAIEFIENENMCIPDKAYYSPLDNGAAHKTYMKLTKFPVSLNRTIESKYRRGDCDETCGEYGVVFTTSKFDMIKKTMGNRTCRYFEGNLKINTDTVTGLETVEEIYGSLTFANAINIRQSFPMLRGIEDRGKQRYRHPALNWAIAKQNQSTRKSLPEFSFQLTRFSFVMIKDTIRQSVRWSSDRGGIENSQVVSFGGLWELDKSVMEFSYADKINKGSDETQKRYKDKFSAVINEIKKRYKESFKTRIYDEIWFKVSVEVAASLLILIVLHIICIFAVPIRRAYKMPVPARERNIEADIITTFQILAGDILMAPVPDVVKKVRQYLIDNKGNIEKWQLENKQEADLYNEEECMEVNTKK